MKHKPTYFNRLSNRQFTSIKRDIIKYIRNYPYTVFNASHLADFVGHKRRDVEETVFWAMDIRDNVWVEGLNVMYIPN